MSQPVLGILTLYLNNAGALEERDVYQKMTVEGKKLGLQVFVFTPQDVNESKSLVRGLFYNPATGLWSRKWTAMPALIFDRSRIQTSHRYDQLLKFRSRHKDGGFLNRPLRNKWAIHALLAKDVRFSSYLPKTVLYGSVRDVKDMLKSCPIVYVKPVNGTGGRGILRIQRDKNGRLLLQGRTPSREIITPRRVQPERLNHFFAEWLQPKTKYIVQQGIQLKLNNGRVHDYRLLVQKDGAGEWKVTGCAGRIGAPGSITANLHGGGRAVKMDVLLKDWIQDDNRISAIKQEVERFGLDIAQYLELCYGALCELAVDIAIERNGRIWMIEVNPKPAREVFSRAGEAEVYRNAIIRPLEYALWKYKQTQGREQGGTS